VTDIFFSYRSTDRDRVRPIRDALATQGFDVFWDQAVPTGVDWDTWIRQHLAKSKCALVFWSSTSIASDNVRHEATVAKMQGKLIQVLLEPLTPDQFPMGLYSQQGVNLVDWAGDPHHEGWRQAIREIESKLTPRWVQKQIHGLDAELTAERARREVAESRAKALHAQIGKEVAAQDQLRRERDTAVDEVATLKAALENLSQTLSSGEANGSDQLRAKQALIAEQSRILEDLRRERDEAINEVATLRISTPTAGRELSKTAARRPFALPPLPEKKPVSDGAQSEAPTGLQFSQIASVVAFAIVMLLVALAVFRS
jgi:hypothetical protein